MRRAIYAGSYDPATNGHVWMFEQGAKLFDELIIAPAKNPEKTPDFTLEERAGIIKRIVRKMPNVKVDAFDKEFLVDYAKENKATYILRGIRSVGDFEFEHRTRNFNYDFDPAIQTVFLIPPKKLIDISSSAVKQLIGFKKWEKKIRPYVPSVVYNNVLEKYRGFSSQWNALWKRIGASGNPKKVYDKLVALHTSPEREHHNLVHLADMFCELELARQFLKNPDAVELAIWFHDSIYNTKAKDNEEKSSELAREDLLEAQTVSPHIITETVQNVMVTQHNIIPKSNDALYFIDMDLAVFGKPEHEFDEYDENIRLEYSHVPEKQYKKARREILTSFLKRKPIYSTSLFRDMYESKAKDNLERAIKRLT